MPSKVATFIQTIKDPTLQSKFGNIISRWLNIPKTPEFDKDMETWQDKNSLLMESTFPWMKTGDHIYLIHKKTQLSPTSWKANLLSSDPDEPIYFKSSETKYLQPVGSIPPLYLMSGIFQKSNKESTFTKEMAHDQFIIDFLNKSFEESGRYPEEDKIQEFILKNKAAINSIRASFKGQPVLLGSGADGTAFAINDHQVLKLFTNKFAYKKALEAVAKLYKADPSAKTEAMIHDIGVLGNFEYPDGVKSIYYYIMEKMQPVEKMGDTETYLRNVVNMILSSLRTRDVEMKKLSSIHGPESYDYLLKLSALVEQDVKKLNAESAAAHTGNILSKNHDSIKKIELKNTALSKKWLFLLCQEIIMKMNTGRKDLHMGNIGLTPYGEFRYFDPSYDEND